MADIVTAICTRLTAHAGTTALIGTRAWIGRLPDNPTYPACVVTLVSGIRTPLMGDDSEKVQSRIQVDAWGATRASAYALGEQVRAALQRWGATSASVAVVQSFIDNELDIYEESVEQWRKTFDFMVWYDE